MKKVLSALIIIVSLVFIGCSKEELVKHDYTFKGENEHWTAEYKVKGESGFIKKGERQIYTAEEKSILTVTYKKDLSDLSTVRNLKISYKNSFRDVTDSHGYDEDNQIKKKVFTMADSSKNSAVVSKNEKATVTIELDGKKETINLK